MSLFRYFIAFTVCLLVLIYIARDGRFTDSSEQLESPSAQRILVFSEPRQLTPFQLGSFSQNQLLHHWTFLFFGFTHCNEVCPLTLTELKRAYALLKGRYPELQVIFVSIDPQRDRGSAVRRYVHSFNQDFIGLSGSSAQTQALQKRFGVVVEQSSATLNHSSSLFLINPQGQWIALFPFGLSAQEIQAQFHAIAEQSSHV